MAQLHPTSSISTCSPVKNDRCVFSDVDSETGKQGTHDIIPSGKRLHNYGTSPFSMGKSTISMVIFNSYVKLPEGISPNQLPKRSTGRDSRSSFLSHLYSSMRNHALVNTKQPTNQPSPFPISSPGVLPVPPAVATSRATFRRSCRLSGRRPHGSCSAASVAVEGPKI
jgi:hypothetical protein